uniref:C2H2-type domain-containing protein n=1 Tax=Macrostomum lignano TaxID=282301 RepID=A0A1I8IM28_9PLAT
YEERANYLESLVHRFQQRDETFEQFAKGVFAPVPAEFPAGGPFGSAVSHQHQQPGSLQLDHADCGGPRLKDELLHVSVQPASDEAATLQQQLQQPHADELQSPQGKSGKAGGDFDLSVAQRLRMSSRRAAKSMRRSVPTSIPSSVSGSLAAGLSNLGPPRKMTSNQKSKAKTGLHYSTPMRSSSSMCRQRSSAQQTEAQAPDVELHGMRVSFDRLQLYSTVPDAAHVSSAAAATSTSKKSAAGSRRQERLDSVRTAGSDADRCCSFECSSCDMLCEMRQLHEFLHQRLLQQDLILHPPLWHSSWHACCSNECFCCCEFTLTRLDSAVSSPLPRRQKYRPASSRRRAARCSGPEAPIGVGCGRPSTSLYQNVQYGAGCPPRDAQVNRSESPTESSTEVDSVLAAAMATAPERGSRYWTRTVRESGWPMLLPAWQRYTPSAPARGPSWSWSYRNHRTVGGGWPRTSHTSSAVWFRLVNGRPEVVTPLILAGDSTLSRTTAALSRDELRGGRPIEPAVLRLLSRTRTILRPSSQREGMQCELQVSQVTFISAHCKPLQCTLHRSNGPQRPAAAHGSWQRQTRQPDSGRAMLTFALYRAEILTVAETQESIAPERGVAGRAEFSTQHAFAHPAGGAEAVHVALELCGTDTTSTSAGCWSLIANIGMTNFRIPSFRQCRLILNDRSFSPLSRSRCACSLNRLRVGLGCAPGLALPVAAEPVGVSTTAVVQEAAALLGVVVVVVPPRLGQQWIGTAAQATFRDRVEARAQKAVSIAQAAAVAHLLAAACVWIVAEPQKRLAARPRVGRQVADALPKLWVAVPLAVRPGHEEVHAFAAYAAHHRIAAGDVACVEKIADAEDACDDFWEGSVGGSWQRSCSMSTEADRPEHRARRWWQSLRLEVVCVASAAGEFKCPTLAGPFIEEVAGQPHKVRHRAGASGWWQLADAAEVGLWQQQRRRAADPPARMAAAAGLQWAAAARRGLLSARSRGAAAGSLAVHQSEEAVPVALATAVDEFATAVNMYNSLLGTNIKNATMLSQATSHALTLHNAVRGLTDASLAAGDSIHKEADFSNEASTLRAFLESNGQTGAYLGRVAVVLDAAPYPGRRLRSSNPIRPVALNALPGGALILAAAEAQWHLAIANSTRRRHDPQTQSSTAVSRHPVQSGLSKRVAVVPVAAALQHIRSKILVKPTISMFEIREKDAGVEVADDTVEGAALVASGSAVETVDADAVLAVSASLLGVAPLTVELSTVCVDSVLNVGPVASGTLTLGVSTLAALVASGSAVETVDADAVLAVSASLLGVAPLTVELSTVCVDSVLNVGPVASGTLTLGVSTLAALVASGSAVETVDADAVLAVSASLLGVAPLTVELSTVCVDSVLNVGPVASGTLTLGVSTLAALVASGSAVETVDADAVLAVSASLLGVAPLTVELSTVCVDSVLNVGPVASGTLTLGVSTLAALVASGSAVETVDADAVLAVSASLLGVAPLTVELSTVCVDSVLNVGPVASGTLTLGVSTLAALVASGSAVETVDADAVLAVSASLLGVAPLTVELSTVCVDSVLNVGPVASGTLTLGVSTLAALVASGSAVETVDADAVLAVSASLLGVAPLTVELSTVCVDSVLNVGPVASGTLTLGVSTLAALVASGSAVETVDADAVLAVSASLLGVAPLTVELSTVCVDSVLNVGPVASGTLTLGVSTLAALVASGSAVETVDADAVLAVSASLLGVAPLTVELSTVCVDSVLNVGPVASGTLTLGVSTLAALVASGSAVETVDADAVLAVSASLLGVAPLTVELSTVCVDSVLNVGPVASGTLTLGVSTLAALVASGSAVETVDADAVLAVSASLLGVAPLTVELSTVCVDSVLNVGPVASGTLTLGVSTLAALVASGSAVETVDADAVLAVSASLLGVAPLTVELSTVCVDSVLNVGPVASGTLTLGVSTLAALVASGSAVETVDADAVLAVSASLLGVAPLTVELSTVCVDSVLNVGPVASGTLTLGVSTLAALVASGSAVETVDADAVLAVSASLLSVSTLCRAQCRACRFWYTHARRLDTGGACGFRFRSGNSRRRRSARSLGLAAGRRATHGRALNCLCRLRAQCRACRFWYTHARRLDTGGACGFRFRSGNSRRRRSARSLGLAAGRRATHGRALNCLCRLRAQCRACRFWYTHARRLDTGGACGFRFRSGNSRRRRSARSLGLAAGRRATHGRALNCLCRLRAQCRACRFWYTHARRLDTGGACGFRFRSGNSRRRRSARSLGLAAGRRLAATHGRALSRAALLALLGVCVDSVSLSMSSACRFWYTHARRLDTGGACGFRFRSGNSRRRRSARSLGLAAGRRATHGRALSLASCSVCVDSVLTVGAPCSSGSHGTVTLAGLSLASGSFTHARRLDTGGACGFRFRSGNSRRRRSARSLNCCLGLLAQLLGVALALTVDWRRLWLPTQCSQSRPRCWGLATGLTLNCRLRAQCRACRFWYTHARRLDTGGACGFRFRISASLLGVAPLTVELSTVCVDSVLNVGPVASGTLTLGVSTLAALVASGSAVETVDADAVLAVSASLLGVAPLTVELSTVCVDSVLNVGPVASGTLTLGVSTLAALVASGSAVETVDADAVLAVSASLLGVAPLTVELSTVCVDSVLNVGPVASGTLTLGVSTLAALVASGSAVETVDADAVLAVSASLLGVAPLTVELSTVCVDSVLNVGPVASGTLTLGVSTLAALVASGSAVETVDADAVLAVSASLLGVAPLTVELSTVCVDSVLNVGPVASGRRRHSVSASLLGVAPLTRSQLRLDTAHAALHHCGSTTGGAFLGLAAGRRATHGRALNCLCRLRAQCRACRFWYTHARRLDTGGACGFRFRSGNSRRRRSARSLGLAAGRRATHGQLELS